MNPRVTHLPLERDSLCPNGKNRQRFLFFLKDETTRGERNCLEISFKTESKGYSSFRAGQIMLRFK